MSSEDRTTRVLGRWSWLVTALTCVAALAGCGTEKVEGRWSLAELELVPGCTLEVEIPREAHAERLDPCESFEAWKRTSSWED